MDDHEVVGEDCVDDHNGMSEDVEDDHEGVFENVKVDHKGVLENIMNYDEVLGESGVDDDYGVGEDSEWDWDLAEPSSPSTGDRNPDPSGDGTVEGGTCVGVEGWVQYGWLGG